jgi:proteasome lid subunit RPN8/RPN11
MSRSEKSTPASMKSGPDVSQLAAESLSEGTFPALQSVPFRVYFEPHAYKAMKAHASEDVSFEICGVLVGDWSRDADGPFVVVRNYVRCDSAAKKFAEVTFTHESWAHINKEMDTKFQDQRIVGWYHSHPNFGIFLSDRDLFIQQNFFSGPGQIALVIDPVQNREGVFEWNQGHAVPTPHYWVGDRIHLAPSGSDETGMPEGPLEAARATPRIAILEAESVSGAIPNLALILLAGMGLFLMGWILSGWRANSDRRSLIEGTVAHFGIWKGLRPDLDVELRTVQRELDQMVSLIKPLATDHLQRAKQHAGETDDAKTADQTSEDWKKLLMAFENVRVRLYQIEKLYTYTPEEYQAVRRYLEQKMVELSKRNPQPESPSLTPPETVDESPR